MPVNKKRTLSILAVFRWRMSLALVLFVSTILLSEIAFSRPVAATGETYMWVGSSGTTIQVNGGDLTGTYMLTSSGSGNFIGEVQWKKSCMTSSGLKANAWFTLLLSTSDNKTGNLSVEGAFNHTPACDFSPGNPSPDSEYQNVTVTIQGISHSPPGPTETYTWVSSDAIEATGGKFAYPAFFTLNQSQSTTLQDEFYAPHVDYNGICYAGKYNGHVDLFISVRNPNTNSPPIPPPIINVDAADTTNDVGAGPQYPYSFGCDTGDGSIIKNTYDGRPITIKCSRTAPCQGTAETHNQKAVDIILHSPLDAAHSPSIVTISIKDSSGNTIQSAAVGQLPDTSSPGKNLVFYTNTFYLDPGNYQVCFTPAFSTAAIPCQSFVKVRYVPLFLNYGANPQDRIDVTVRAHFVVLGGCFGGSYKAGPALVERDNLQGDQLDVARTTFTVVQINEGECAKAIAFLYTSFIGVPAGDYKICAVNNTNDKVCSLVHKVPDQPVSVTLDVTLGWLQPADQPSCMSNAKGWISVTAWPVCIGTPILTGTIMFLQNNFIIPYLTILPLKLGL